VDFAVWNLKFVVYPLYASQNQDGNLAGAGHFCGGSHDFVHGAAVRELILVNFKIHKIYKIHKILG